VHACTTRDIPNNTKLSEERAKAVVAYLMQQGNVPIRHIVAPGAMGEYGQPPQMRLKRDGPKTAALRLRSWSTRVSLATRPNLFRQSRRFCTHALLFSQKAARGQ
jgi:hypothetical protein